MRSGFFRRFVAAPVLLLAPVLSSAQTHSVSYLAYDATAQPPGCSKRSTISYTLPDPSKYPPPYPVFMYTPATFADPSGDTAQIFVNGMAALGFLSASIPYPNQHYADGCTLDSNGGHGGYTEKAQCIYQTSLGSSAINALCAVANANCSLGVVTAGHSQGAAIAILAANYASQVRATYALSMSDYNESTAQPLMCMQGTNIAGMDKLVVVNGASDDKFGYQSDIMGMWAAFGLHQSAPCNGVAPCQNGTNSQAGGAGWYLVQDFQVQNHYAGHCYFINGPPKGNLECLATTYDATWIGGGENWSLSPNLGWLASFGAQRAPSSDGN